LIEDQVILVECIGPVMHVTLSRPEVLNALNSDAHFLLDEAFNRFAGDSELQIATITGSGDRSFCAGTDLKARLNEETDRFPETGFAGLTERFDLTKPVVALVNGDAIGGGLEIILACDLAIAVEQARFGLPEPRVGLAAKGGLHRLARQIPMKHAMKIALTGNLFDAQTALEYGLINQIVEKKNFVRECQCMLDTLLECAPLSLRASKEMIQKGLSASSMDEAFKLNYPEHATMLYSYDTREGSETFLEKRTPLWRGR
jgi:crotonobetainyl-CoA hydratase